MTPSLVPLQVGCPACRGNFSLLKAAWQSQRKSVERLCPLCHTTVEVVFSGLRLLMAISAVMLSAVLAGNTQIEVFKWLGYLLGMWWMNTIAYLRLPKLPK
jgi:hypothetical protein